MKAQIVYTSFTGNNDLLAKEIQKRTGADLLPILEKRKRNGWTVFLDIAFNRIPEITNYYDPTAYYDHHIFVAPIWAGHIASPLKAFLAWEKRKIKAYSFITLCGDSSQKQKEKIIKELTALVGFPPSRVEELSVSDLVNERTTKESVTGFRLKEGDLKFFDSAIEEFLTDQLVPARHS